MQQFAAELTCAAVAAGVGCLHEADMAAGGWLTLLRRTLRIQTKGERDCCWAVHAALWQPVELVH